MENILEVFQTYKLYILFGVIIIIQLITTLVMTKSMGKLKDKYRKLTRGINNDNLENIVLNYMDKIDEVQQENKQLKIENEELREKLKTCIQKVSVVRYKAFEDVGSDLSFSVALLDENNDGIVLTGIYARTESTTYAKPIDQGISRYDLSEEEKDALKKAMNFKSK